MKIAINCAFLQPKGGGIKEYILNLVDNLYREDKENTYVCYCLADNLDYARKKLPPGISIKTIPFNSSTKLDVIKRSLTETNFWRKEEERENFDIFHSPFFHAPKLKNTPVVLTVHDMRFYRFPETYDFMRYHFLKHKVKNSVKRASHIISISRFTKDELVEAYGLEPEKITVVHEAINPERFKAEASAVTDAALPELKDSPFLLAVGHLEPRKNYDRLIAAFEKIKATGRFPGLKLVIVGKKGHSYSGTLKLIASDPDIIYPEFVSHETLLWLYGNAALHIFPSYYEGFGFPPLEAAMQGTVSAVSNISCMPEVCGDAVFYFDPYDIDNMAEVITEGLEKGPSYAHKKDLLATQLHKYSWKKNALETISVYNRLKKEMHL